MLNISLDVLLFFSFQGSAKRHLLRHDTFEPEMNNELSEVHRSESSISLAIETAFDFLNCEDCESDSE